MKLSDNYHEVITAEELKNYFTEESLSAIMENLEEEAKDQKRKRGIGVFLFEDMETTVHGKINLAFTAEWSTQEDGSLTLGLLKCHLYTTTMPDEVLDDMNKINEVATDVEWKTLDDKTEN